MNRAKFVILERLIAGGLLAALLGSAATAEDAGNNLLKTALARLSREGAQFIQAAPHLSAEETLTQRRFDFGRLDKNGNPAIATHVVVSSYGFVALGTVVREIRQVASVDKREVRSSPADLQTIAQDVLSTSDPKKMRKAMEGFEKHGLKGVATNFGDALQLFAGDKASKFEFSAPLVSKDKKLAVYQFQQLDGEDGMTIFETGRTIKLKLKGNLYVMPETGFPGRIDLFSEWKEGDTQVLDMGWVVYTPDATVKSLVPSQAGHRQFRGGRLAVEDIFEYGKFSVRGS